MSLGRQVYLHSLNNSRSLSSLQTADASLVIITRRLVWAAIVVSLSSQSPALISQAIASLMRRFCPAVKNCFSPQATLLLKSYEIPGTITGPGFGTALESIQMSGTTLLSQMIFGSIWTCGKKRCILALSKSLVFFQVSLYALNILSTCLVHDLAVASHRRVVSELYIPFKLTQQPLKVHWVLIELRTHLSS